MSIKTTVNVAAATLLPALNHIVAQQEGFHGPLLAIGNDGSHTQLTFDNVPVSPDTNAVIAPQDAGNPKIPFGATLVCTGTIFIAGQLTLSAATR